MKPMMAGTIAPPIMDITRRDEPSLVYAPRFLMLSAKIVGNMMESKKPSRTTAPTGAIPVVTIATIVHTAAAVEKRPSSFGAAQSVHSSSRGECGQ
jgi:hypothetical protein